MERARQQLRHETRVLGDALDALTRTTGLKTRMLAREPKAAKGKQPDAEIIIKNADRTYRYVVEVKTVDRTVALAAAKHQLDPFGRKGVLVAPYLTAELANYCREILDLQFIDTAGNAYLRGPGLYVYIRGERLPMTAPTTRGTGGGGTPTALRVVFALLCKPELLNAPYRDIVTAAGVALGAVGWVFYDLEGRGLIAGKQRKRNRRFLNPERLLNEWVTNYPIKLRPKLAKGTFRAADPEWWRKAQLQHHGAVWGGEVAADRMTGNREPGRLTLYIQGDPGKFLLEHRLRADPHGDIEILEKFWDFEAYEAHPKDLAPPVLVYADLMATLDPRNHDTAKLIYNEFCTNALGKT